MYRYLLKIHEIIYKFSNVISLQFYPHSGLLSNESTTTSYLLKKIQYISKKTFRSGFERKMSRWCLPRQQLVNQGLADKWTCGNYFRDNSNANEGPVIFCLGTFLRDMYSPSDVKLIWISIAHRSRGAHVHFFSNQMALNFIHSFLVFLVG